MTPFDYISLAMDGGLSFQIAAITHLLRGLPEDVSRLNPDTIVLRFDVEHHGRSIRHLDQARMDVLLSFDSLYEVSIPIVGILMVEVVWPMPATVSTPNPPPRPGLRLVEGDLTAETSGADLDPGPLDLDPWFQTDRAPDAVLEEAFKICHAAVTAQGDHGFRYRRGSLPYKTLAAVVIARCVVGAPETEAALLELRIAAAAQAKPRYDVAQAALARAYLLAVESIHVYGVASR